MNAEVRTSRPGKASNPNILIPQSHAQQWSACWNFYCTRYRVTSEAARIALCLTLSLPIFPQEPSSPRALKFPVPHTLFPRYTFSACFRIRCSLRSFLWVCERDETLFTRGLTGFSGVETALTWAASARVVAAVAKKKRRSDSFDPTLRPTLLLPSIS